jgi:hypothetical protein
MPRPKKPPNLKFDFQAPPRTARVTLGQDTRDFLAKCLVIDEKDKARIGEMATYIERVLTNHKFQSARPDKPPTFASQIRLFESLENSAFALRKEFRPFKKNNCTFLTLYSYIGLSKAALPAEARKSLYPNIGHHEAPFVDPEAEYESDVAALEKISNRIHLGLKILNSQKKQGRVKDYTLRMTVKALCSLFKKYNQSNKRIFPRLRKFIATALDAAEISHPPLRTTEFYRLVKSSWFPQASSFLGDNGKVVK